MKQISATWKGRHLSKIRNISLALDASMENAGMAVA